MPWTASPNTTAPHGTAGLALRWLSTALSGCAVAMVALIAPATAWGQGFTLPDGALTPVTQIRLSYRTLDSDSTTEVSGVTEEQTSAKHEGASTFLGLYIDPVIVGGSGSIDDFSIDTSTFRYQESRHSGTGFVTLGLGVVALVLSSSQFVEDSEVEDRATSIRVNRRMELDTDVQYAFFIRLPFFQFGYAMDHRRLKLEYNTAIGGTPLLTLIERYKFQSETQDFALLLEGERGPFLVFRRAHSEAEAEDGDVFDFDGAEEDLTAVSAGWRFGPREAITLIYRTVELRFGFTGLTQLEANEVARSLVIDLPQGLSVQITAAEEETLNTFANAGGLESIETKRSRIEVGLGWRF